MSPLARNAAPSQPAAAVVPLNQAAQGGLIDDLDVAIADAMFTQWDYNGAIDHEVLALGIQFTDANGKSYEQYYSAGELTYFVPSPDGGTLIPVGDKSLINDNTNAWKFLMSCMEADATGTIAEMLATGNVKNLVGMECHVKQFAQPKRQGLIRGGKNPDREPTCLLVEKIYVLPGGQALEQAETAPPATAPARQAAPVRQAAPARQAAAAPQRAVTGRPGLGGQPAASPKAQSRPAVAGKPVNGRAGADLSPMEDSLAILATQVVQEIVAERGTLAKKDLNTAVFGKATERVKAKQLDPKQKTALIQLAYQDSFLHGLVSEGVISYDGAEIGPPA